MIELKKYFPNLSQDQLEKFMRLVPIYKDWNSKVNLISRRDIENLFTNHILHSLSIVNIIEFESSTSVLDVGTGGGFPGIPLAIFFPNVKFTLLDSIGKKIKVVESVSKDLSLSNVTAINDRVENHFDKYDFILSRAVAKMDKFYSLVNKNFNSKSVISSHSVQIARYFSRSVSGIIISTPSVFCIKGIAPRSLSHSIVYSIVRLSCPFTVILIVNSGS